MKAMRNDHGEGLLFSNLEVFYFFAIAPRLKTTSFFVTVLQFEEIVQEISPNECTMYMRLGLPRLISNLSIIFFI